ncbi:MAG: FAD-dependent oxidoreductase [Candidatus Nanopelagicales bacterium]|jgi:glycine/D-amino acid oxidase-like deaminating enzyme/nitrite reductase/ring-hydroxylating ferredoxin subunit|nr:FAD-dependent oxidoreductase [Candidatus Nanopelagicales bacterium]
MDQRATEVHTSLWWGRRGRPAEPWTAAGPGPALPDPSAEHEVVIVGAGLTGLSTAVMLARRGVRPLVLEARHVAAGTTGHSTAKLSLLQGAVYSGIAGHHGSAVVRAYGEMQRAGQAWLLDFCQAAGVPVQHRDAWTYAVTEQGASTVAKEARACATAGLEVEHTASTELPFDVRAAIRLPDQVQFDPVDVCVALRDELVSLGGSVVEGVTVTGVELGTGRGGGADGAATLRTSAGEVRARRIVLASGIPVLDRGLYFAKLKPQRSYALAYRMPAGASIPQGMYLSVDSPSRSLRTAPHEDGELLVVGGNGHVVGRSSSPNAAVADLDAWTGEHFPGATLAWSWAAQDYQAAGQVPFVGGMPRSNDQILLATGFNKWGMTNAAAAAQMLVADLVGDGAASELAWAKPLRTRITTPRDLVSGLELNGTVGWRMVRDWAGHLLPHRDGDARRPAEGEGRVDGGRRPVGTCTVAGQTHRVDAVCPHLGGILAWNDSDLTWDCPLHGSRFTADGHRLEGPALSDLEPR